MNNRWIYPKKNKVTYWKRIASWLTKIQIDHSSEDGLEILLTRGHIIMDSKNGSQSYGELQAAFHDLFLSLNLYSKPIENVLIIGFGLGSIAALLQKNSQIQYIAGIESNAQVLLWLDKYYHHPKIQVYMTIDEVPCHHTFDLIIIDAFEDLHLPAMLYHVDWWTKLFRYKKDNACIIWNTLPINQTLIPTEIKSLFSKFYISPFENKFYIQSE